MRGSSPPRRGPLQRLSIAALGLALVLLMSGIWATAAVYLAVRAGLPAPVRLAVIDTIHVYVGLASLIFLGAKVGRVGLRVRVAGLQHLLLWHRWVSWSLVALYSAVYLTGALLLLGWRQDVKSALVNAHLLTSVWAAVPTTWHVWHHRRMALPVRWGRRVAGGVALVVVPALLFASVPRALSPLAAAGLGNSWTPLALSNTFIDKLAATADGRFLVAGGIGLHVEDRQQATWRRVPLPVETGREPAVLALTIAPGRPAVYVGTARGLYASSDPSGPYHSIPFPSIEIHGVAVDPADPSVIWASSRGGFWRSNDGGEHWESASQGIANRKSAWAITYFHDALYASDAEAVYRWTGSEWRPVLHQKNVYGFDAGLDGTRLFSSSMGGGIRVFDGQRWSESDSGFRSHNGGVHVVAINEISPQRAYAATMDGVGVSIDGGRSWLPLAAGIGPGGVWRVIADGPDRLLAATDHGLYRYALIPDAQPGGAWWVSLLLVAAAAGLLSVAVVALRQERGAPTSQ